MKSKLGQWLDQQFLKWQISQGGSKTVVEFAHYLGVSRDALYKWMNGQRVPDLEYIEKLADKLGVEIYDMLGLQRPNEHLSRVKTVWDNLSEAEQEAYAAEIERIAASNKQKLVEKQKREKPVKTPPVSRAAKPSA